MKPKNNPKFKHLFDLAEKVGKDVKKHQTNNFVKENIPERRSFLQKAALGGLGLGAFMSMPIEDTLAHSMQHVNRNSNPSDLRITDLRIAEVANAPMRCPIIRIDTNQGIYGLGEVRDGASARYALVLKSRILGENPCQVERLFKIKLLETMPDKPEVFVA